MTSVAERSLKLTIEYDGTSFHGWQVQEGVRTVQGTLLDVLKRLCSGPIDLQGASRTDRGVHALGQCASLRAATGVPMERFAQVLNGRLPADVAVRAVEEVGPEFHARFSATGKLYRYWIDLREPPSAFASRYALPVMPPLDVDRMREAAVRFIGEHDFASYQCVSKGTIRETLRRVDDIRIVPVGGLVAIDVLGRSFLYKMVRSMVGALLDVGKGRWEPSRISESLEARSRAAGGRTAPGHGLFLVHVSYTLPPSMDAPPFASLEDLLPGRVE